MKIMNSDERLNLIKSYPAGKMSWICKNVNDENKNEFIFYVREDRKYINKQGNNPIFKVRSLIVNTEIISALLIMVKINNDSDLLYDCWVNYSAPVVGVTSCEALTIQSYLKFVFIDEFGQESKVIKIDNLLKNEMNYYINCSKKRYPWIMEEFDFVKNYIYKKYPNGQVLWNNIATMKHEYVTKDELSRAGKKGSVKIKEIYYFKL